MVSLGGNAWQIYESAALHAGRGLTTLDVSESGKLLLTGGAEGLVKVQGLDITLAGLKNHVKYLFDWLHA